MKTIIRYTLLPVLIVILIFVGTILITPDQLPDIPGGFPWDKLVHFGMFFLLSAVIMYDYYRFHDGKPNKFKWFFWSFVMPVIYGGLIELAQKYVVSYRGVQKIGRAHV